MACAFIDLNVRADSSQHILDSVCVCVWERGSSDTGSAGVLEQVRVHLAPAANQLTGTRKALIVAQMGGREDLIFAVPLLHQLEKYPGSFILPNRGFKLGPDLLEQLNLSKKAD